ncbi:ABC transporter substrate-binding protein [Chloroflexi bacterium TSY]|nr:ABC transporter substrate-binding protein [Chloroflexi bacterium TSY]
MYPSRFIVLVLLPIGLIVGCVPVATPGDSGASLSTEPVEIQVFYPVAVDAPIAEILNGYAAAFEAENPDIRVEPVFAGGYGDVKTTLQTTVEGGGTPPALAVMLATDLYDLVNGDLIVPLDDYIAAMEDSDVFLSDIYPAFLANSMYDDALWSLPFQRSVVALYYNADLLAELGIEPPTSWDELANAAQALTIKDGDEFSRLGIEWPSGWPYWLFQPLAIGNGQNIVADDTTVVFDDPHVIDAVQFYIDLAQEYGAMPAGVQAVWGQTPSDFASGAAAMIVHSSGSLAGILDSADFEVGVMPLPGNNAVSYATVPGGGNLYILNGAPQEQQDAAWKFIEFLSRPENMADYSINTGYIASRASAYEVEVMQEYLDTAPQAAALRDSLQHAGAELSVQNLGEVRNIFHNYLQAAYNGEMTAAEAMAKAQEEADAALADFR